MKLPQISSVTEKLQSVMPKRQPDQPAAFVLCDVGASMIRAAVVTSDAEAVHIIGKGSAIQDEQAMVGGVIGQLDSVIEKMDEAITQAADMAGMGSDQLILGLGGTLVGGMTTMVHLNRPQPKEKISEKELTVMLERISQTALVDAETVVGQEMGLQKQDLRLINSGITSISLDGYPLPSPVGFSGKEVEFCLFNAFVGQSTLVALQKILTDLNMDLASLNATAYAVAQLLLAGAKKPLQVSGLVVDAGAGSTSVTLVEHGAVAGSKTFPLGGRAITAHLGQVLSVNPTEAEQAKLDYALGKTSDVQRHKIKTVAEQEAKLWQRGLGLALAELQPEKALPDHVYLTGQGSLLPELQPLLEKEAWAKEAGFNAAPTVELLKIVEMPGVVDETHQLKAGDESLWALALALRARQQEDGHVSAAFQKTLESLGG